MDAAKTAAGAAAGVMINASASAKAAADINDECLRRLSKPSVTYEGGGIFSHCGHVNSMVAGGHVNSMVR
jgi:hypothetical protein